MTPLEDIVFSRNPEPVVIYETQTEHPASFEYALLFSSCPVRYSSLTSMSQGFGVTNVLGMRIPFMVVQQSCVNSKGPLGQDGLGKLSIRLGAKRAEALMMQSECNHF